MQRNHLHCKRIRRMPCPVRLSALLIRPLRCFEFCHDNICARRVVDWGSLSHSNCVAFVGGTRVFGELNPETLLRVGNPLHRTNRDFELEIAKRANPHGRDHSNPLQNSQIAFRHETTAPRNRIELQTILLSMLFRSQLQRSPDSVISDTG
jgi:hypothetical protein